MQIIYMTGHKSIIFIDTFGKYKQVFSMCILFFYAKHCNVPTALLIAIGKGREVPELCWLGVGYTHILWWQWGTFCSRGVPCGDENAHGIPFEGILLSPSHMGGEQKRKSCGATSLPFFTTQRKRKVGGTTSARKSADSWIFSKKGNCVA